MEKVGATAHCHLENVESPPSSAGPVLQYRAPPPPHHLVAPSICEILPFLAPVLIWEVAAQDPRLKLSLVRSTLQHWVSRPSCHLAQFPSQPTMMVEHLQPPVKKYQHCPTCTMVAPELEPAPITTVAALVQIGGGGNNRSFRD